MRVYIYFEYNVLVYFERDIFYDRIKWNFHCFPAGFIVLGFSIRNMWN